MYSVGEDGAAGGIAGAGSVLAAPFTLVLSPSLAFGFGSGFWPISMSSVVTSTGLADFGSSVTAPSSSTVAPSSSGTYSGQADTSGQCSRTPAESARAKSIAFGYFAQPLLGFTRLARCA